ncbi:MAG: hypothetical protein RL563_2184, partial [Pseudomonadota bacterium]
MKSFIQSVLTDADSQPQRLLTILRSVQAKYQHIPEQAIEMIAESLQIPRTQIIAVAEFYSFLHLTPQGRYDILISDSITDHMLGNQAIIDQLSKVLNVKIGEVRQDGLVSLNHTSCTGMCDQGPAALINGLAITHLNSAKVRSIANLIESQTPLCDWPSEFFNVDDNLHRKDLLLNSEWHNGEALKAAFARGLTQTLEELDRSGLR